MTSHNAALNLKPSLRRGADMSDPVTIGALAASALAMASEAMLKGAVGEAVKDAYGALKRTLGRWAKSDVDALRSDPESSGRQMVIAEAIDQRATAEDKVRIQALAEALVSALKSGGPVGLDIQRLESLGARFGEISVTDGVGVRIGEAIVHGVFEAGPISVGSDQKKNELQSGCRPSSRFNDRPPRRTR